MSPLGSDGDPQANSLKKRIVDRYLQEFNHQMVIIIKSKMITKFIDIFIFHLFLFFRRGIPQY